MRPTRPTPHTSPRLLARAALTAGLALVLALLPGSPVSHARDDTAEQVESVLSRMSLEEKVGQVFMVFFYEPYLTAELTEMISEYHVGGIILYEKTNNVRNPTQVAGLTRAAQTEALKSGGVGLLVAADQEGGPVARLKHGFTHMPSNMALGATGDPESARKAALAMAREMAAVGVNMNLAPVVDVNNNPGNPIIGIRSFGGDPFMVAAFGEAALAGYRAGGVIPCAKHFPGHGDTEMDSHLGLPVLPFDRQRLDRVELLPFTAMTLAGVPAIMTAHVAVPAVTGDNELPATMSPDVLTGLLRRDLGFGGLIITDSLGMGALEQRYPPPAAALAAFTAGADILLFGADKGHTPEEQKLAYERLLLAVMSEEVSQARLNDSVRRILEVKARYGLLTGPGKPGDIRVVGSPEHLDLALDLAQKSVTLLRNQDGLLPLSPDASTLLVCPESAQDLARELVGLHPGLDVVTIPADPSLEDITRVSWLAAEYDVVVAATYDAGKNKGQADLVKELNRACDRLTVLALGSPYDILEYPDVSTYLVTYGDAPVQLGAAARVLMGLARPAGRLPVDIPGMFPKGYGMSEFGDFAPAPPAGG